MNLYKPRPVLLPAIKAHITENPGPTLRELARRYNCHIQTIKATIQDQFQIHKHGTAYHIFPIEFNQDYDTYLTKQQAWWPLLADLNPKTSTELAEATNWPLSTAKHRLRKYRTIIQSDK